MLWLSNIQGLIYTKTALLKNNNTLRKTIKYVSKFYLYEKVLKVDAKEDNAVTDILNMYEC